MWRECDGTDDGGGENGGMIMGGAEDGDITERCHLQLPPNIHSTPYQHTCQYDNPPHNFHISYLMRCVCVCVCVYVC